MRKGFVVLVDVATPRLEDCGADAVDISSHLISLLFSY